MEQEVPVHFLKSLQVRLFPWERVPRKRFFWAIFGFTAATYLVAILPGFPSFIGMELEPPVITAVWTFVVICVLFFRLCSGFYAWWRIYDATLSKGTTWVLWLIGTALWFGLRDWAVIVPLYLVFVLLPSKAGEE